MTSRSTTRNVKPGVMKMSVSPVAGNSAPPRAADSSDRTVVVPTATMRPPAARVARMASTVSAPTSYHSLCMRCSAMRATRTGWNVPAPTCSVTRAVRTPRSASAARTPSSKCSAAVGAATAPGRDANTVW